MANKRDGVSNEDIVFPLTVSDPLGNVYDSKMYDEASYDDTGDFDDLAVASGNTVALRATLTKNAATNTVSLRKTDITRTLTGNTATLKRLNLVKTGSGNTAALKKVNVVKTATGNTVALKAVVAKTVTGNKVALRGTRTATALATVALRGTRTSRALGNTVALKRLNSTRLASGNTVSLYDSRIPHVVRVTKNTVALKLWTVLNEIPQPSAVLTEINSMSSALVEVPQASVAFAVVAPVETAIFPTISWTIDTTAWAITSLTEVRTDAAEAWYDTELYDVSMYDETQAPVLIEQPTATALINATERASASLVSVDVTCVIEPVGTTQGALYDDQLYDQYFYDDTRTSIIEVGITEYPQASADIRRV